MWEYKRLTLLPGDGINFEVQLLPHSAPASKIWLSLALLESPSLAPPTSLSCSLAPYWLLLEAHPYWNLGSGNPDLMKQNLNNKARLTRHSRCAIKRPMVAAVPFNSSRAWSKLPKAQNLSLLICIMKIIPTLPSDGLLGKPDEIVDCGSVWKLPSTIRTLFICSVKSKLIFKLK